MSDQSTFIYDFFVSSEYRGFGFGTQSISALEAQLQKIGISQMLRVAYHNERALKLYKDVGFRSLASICLRKSLGSGLIT